MADKKVTITELVETAAKAAAREALQLQEQRSSINLYAAMEHLLRSYTRLKQLADHPEDYVFFRANRSHDIASAPPAGTVFRDKVDLEELFTEAREKAFVKTMARFVELEAVIKLFENRREFIVIRMYYFNEDPMGNDRGLDAKRYTFDAIAEELSLVGIDKNVKTLREWRSRLVQEMTVALFGTDGAISLATKTTVKKDTKSGGPEDEG